VKRAILTHRIDFAAIAILIVGAIVVSGYILEHQPSFVFGQSYYTVKAPFATAAAVTAGQGQAVTIAGVQVGQVGGVSLQDGQAVVTMHIYKRYAPIYRNATVLLRPRTPLKDMYLALDPGTKSAGAVPDGGSLSAAQTNPDVDVSQILSSLDADTRNYLILLLANGAEAFHDHGSLPAAPSPPAVGDLRGTFKRFQPLDRDTLTLTPLIAGRPANLHRAIHGLNLVASSHRRSTTSRVLISSSRHEPRRSRPTTPRSVDADAVPGTLRQTTGTVDKVKGCRRARLRSRGCSRSRNLGPRWRFAATVPRHDAGDQSQLRPFSVAVQPLAKTLAPASARSQAVPALEVRRRANDLFNTLTCSSPPRATCWGGRPAPISDSLPSAQDANGAVVQGIFMGTCTELNFFEGTLEPGSIPLGVILNLLNPPPVADLPGVTSSTGLGTTQYTCPTSP
jgi:phospholipid/cholesterol/gamma-HCH transport system substrate-binding protein